MSGLQNITCSAKLPGLLRRRMLLLGFSTKTMTSGTTTTTGAPLGPGRHHSVFGHVSEGPELHAARKDDGSGHDDDNDADGVGEAGDKNNCADGACAPGASGCAGECVGGFGLAALGSSSPSRVATKASSLVKTSHCGIEVRQLI